MAAFGLLFLLLTCTTNSDSKYAEIEGDIEEAAMILNGDLRTISKRLGAYKSPVPLTGLSAEEKAKEDKKPTLPLSKYFKKIEGKEGQIDDSKLPAIEATDSNEKRLEEVRLTKLKRRLADTYLSLLLGRLGLSLLEMIADLMTVNGSDDTQGTFSLLGQFIPEPLRSKKKLDANLGMLNLVDGVYQGNFALEVCLNLVGRTSEKCCEQVPACAAGDTACTKKEEACLAATDDILDRRPKEWDDDDSIRAAQNKGLTTIATISCFTSIIRSSVISVNVMGGTLDEVSESLSSDEGAAAMALNLTNGVGFDEALSELKAASSFLEDMTNMTTKSCVDSGLIPTNDPFVTNMKKLREDIDENIATYEQFMDQDAAMEAALTDFIATQNGVRCNENRTECCSMIEDPKGCAEKYGAIAPTIPDGIAVDLSADQSGLDFDIDTDAEESDLDVDVGF